MAFPPSGKTFLQSGKTLVKHFRHKSAKIRKYPVKHQTSATPLKPPKTKRISAFSRLHPLAFK